MFINYSVVSIPGEISEEESDKCMGEMVGTNLDEEQPCGIINMSVYSRRDQ